MCDVVVTQISELQVIRSWGSLIFAISQVRTWQGWTRSADDTFIFTLMTVSNNSWKSCRGFDPYLRQYLSQNLLILFYRLFRARSPRNWMMQNEGELDFEKLTKGTDQKRI